MGRPTKYIRKEDLDKFLGLLDNQDITYLMKYFGEQYRKKKNIKNVTIDEVVRLMVQEYVNSYYWQIYSYTVLYDLLKNTNLKIPNIFIQKNLYKKFIKIINKFIETYYKSDNNIYTITLDEKLPGRVTIGIVFDFYNYMETPYEKFTPIEKKIISKNPKWFVSEILFELNDYFNMTKLDNSVFEGGLSVSTGVTHIINEEKWVKNILNKVIKPKLRDIGRGHVHGIRYSPNLPKSRIEIVWKQSYWREGSTSRQPILQAMKDLINEIGYSDKIDIRGV